RDKGFNREIFDTVLKAKVLRETWRREYNRVRPHSPLGYRPPAPEAREPFPLIETGITSNITTGT
ncbi:MAG: integrase core domain-containing protein, partial [Bacteroidota bacterium]